VAWRGDRRRKRKTQRAEIKTHLGQTILFRGMNGVCLWATTNAGFEGLVAKEIDQVFGLNEGARIEPGNVFAKVDQQKPFDVELVWKLRTVDSVFIMVLSEEIKVEDVPETEALKAISDSVAKVDESALEQVLEIWKAFRRYKNEGKITFKVFKKRIGNRHQFASPEIPRAVFLGMPSTWEGVLNDPDLSILANLNGSRLRLGIKLNDTIMSHKTFQIFKYSRELSSTPLKALVAYLMVLSTSPRSGDVVLDSMTGCGTIGEVVSSELKDLGLFALIGDRDQKILDKARNNMERNPWQGHMDIVRWDATRLPLRDGCIQRIAVDMPFGIHSGKKKKNEELYMKAIQEFERVVFNEEDSGMFLLAGDERAAVRVSEKYESLEFASIRMGGRKVPTLKILHDCIRDNIWSVIEQGEDEIHRRTLNNVS